MEAKRRATMVKINTMLRLRGLRREIEVGQDGALTEDQATLLTDVCQVLGITHDSEIYYVVGEAFANFIAAPVTYRLAGATADSTLVMTRTGFAPAKGGTEFREWPKGPSVVWSGDHKKARARKDWSFAMCRQLVERWGIRAGDAIELHISLKYARYIQRRLETYGCPVAIPTARHNLGQKLSWYTERCSSVTKPDLATLQED